MTIFILFLLQTLAFVPDASATKTIVQLDSREEALDLAKLLLEVPLFFFYTKRVPREEENVKDKFNDNVHMYVLPMQKCLENSIEKKKNDGKLVREWGSQLSRFFFFTSRVSMEFCAEMWLELAEHCCGKEETKKTICKKALQIMHGPLHEIESEANEAYAKYHKIIDDAKKGGISLPPSFDQEESSILTGIQAFDKEFAASLDAQKIVSNRRTERQLQTLQERQSQFTMNRNRNAHSKHRNDYQKKAMSSPQVNPYASLEKLYGMNQGRIRVFYLRIFRLAKVLLGITKGGTDDGNDNLVEFQLAKELLTNANAGKEHIHSEAESLEHFVDGLLEEMITKTTKPNAPVQRYTLKKLDLDDMRAIHR